MARIRLFAAAAEAAGTGELSRDEASLGELRSALSTEFPALAGILPRCAVLVEGSRTADDTLLHEATVIDILPPFAGG